ncbi:josephin-like protein [Chenopodium quinoa]|uniref:ubiquitinyl hydrolase 1 n=1 Tax=Chenopodium quinoa TaxID=63459 RepID=A0A803LXA0_CHEQI|nr:josephin-like protein [Chenopodium quinoa]
MEEQIKSGIYHERQRLQFCLLHALNNLFQEKVAFSRTDLDGIAEELNLGDPTPVNWNPISVVFKPHHNLFTGNYDVNVLIAAIERKGKNIVWHDRRNGASSISVLDGSEDDGLMGIVLNIPVKRYGGLWKNRHWVSLRKINGVWYNLDSDLKAPIAFEDVDEVRVFLDSVILAGGEILLVMNGKQQD